MLTLPPYLFRTVSLSSVTQTGKSSRQKANGTRSLLTLFCHMLFAGTFFLPLQLFSANFTRITASLSETIKCNYCRRTKWFSNAATTRSFSICGWELHCIIANWRQVHSSSKRVLAHFSLSLSLFQSVSLSTKKEHCSFLMTKVVTTRITTTSAAAVTTTTVMIINPTHA